MGIFNKIFKRKNLTLRKSDIRIFAESMDEPVVRKDKDYVVIGYYNDNKTRFKNILNGKSYKCTKPFEEEKTFVIGGKKMFNVGNDLRLFGENLEEERFLGPTIDENAGEFDWLSSLKVGRGTWSEEDWTYFPNGKDNKMYMNFLLADEKELFNVEQMKEIANVINDHAHDFSLKELEKSQEQANTL